MRGPASLAERAAALVAAILLFVPRPATAALGAGVLGLTAAVHWTRTARAAHRHESDVTARS